MIALNIVLMLAVVVALVSLLGWSIVSDRHSERSAGGEVPPELAPLHRNLEMPRELRDRHTARPRPEQRPEQRPERARAERSRRGAARATMS